MHVLLLSWGSRRSFGGCGHGIFETRRYENDLDSAVTDWTDLTDFFLLFDVVSGMSDPVIDEHFRRSLGERYTHLFASSTSSTSSTSLVAADSSTNGGNPSRDDKLSSTVNVTGLSGTKRRNQRGHNGNKMTALLSSINSRFSTRNSICPQEYRVGFSNRRVIHATFRYFKPYSVVLMHPFSLSFSVLALLRLPSPLGIRLDSFVWNWTWIHHT